VLADLTAEARRTEFVEAWFAVPEERRGDGAMNLVEKPFAQVLARRGRAPADSHVPVACCRAGEGERGVYAAGEKVGRRPSLHYKMRARVMGEDKDANVMGRSPTPRATNRWSTPVPPSPLRIASC